MLSFYRKIHIILSNFNDMILIILQIESNKHDKCAGKDVLVLIFYSIDSLTPRMHNNMVQKQLINHWKALTSV